MQSLLHATHRLEVGEGAASDKTLPSSVKWIFDAFANTASAILIPEGEKTADALQGYVAHEKTHLPLGPL